MGVLSTPLYTVCHHLPKRSTTSEIWRCVDVGREMVDWNEHLGLTLPKVKYSPQTS
jgi:hypothetical protein